MGDDEPRDLVRTTEQETLSSECDDVLPLGGKAVLVRTTRKMTVSMSGMTPELAKHELELARIAAKKDKEIARIKAVADETISVGPARAVMMPLWGVIASLGVALVGGLIQKEPSIVILAVAGLSGLEIVRQWRKSSGPGSDRPPTVKNR